VVTAGFGVKKELNILVICQYYPPDIGGGSRRVSNAISGLISLGHKIEVVTAFPHYPHGKVPLTYRRRILAIECENDRRIIRVWVPPVAHSGFARRLFMYVMFSVSALFALFTIQRPDVIWAANTNVFSSFPAKIYSIIWRAPLVRNVDDLWPETALDEGVLNRKLLWIGELLAKLAYSQCKTSTTISRSYVSEIENKYKIPKTKFFVAEVGVDTDIFHPYKKKPANQYAPQKFTILYSGIIGPGYDFDTIVAVAKQLIDESEIEFVIRGSGESMHELAEKVAKERLTNITMNFEYLEIGDLVTLLGTANVLVLPMMPLGSHTAGIPTKLFEYMACGRPIICCCSGETKQIIEHAKCGITVKPGDSTGLAKAILKMRNDSDLGNIMGENGRKFVVKEYSTQRIGEKLEQAFKSALGSL